MSVLYMPYNSILIPVQESVSDEDVSKLVQEETETSQPSLVETLKETHKKQVEDLVETHNKAMEALKETQERQIDALKKVEERQVREITHP